MTDHLSRETIGAFERLEGGARLRAVSHLVDCAECRGSVAGRDSAALFSLLRRHPVPRADLDDVSRAVMTEIESLPVTISSRRRARRTAFSGRGWLGLAAGLLLAVILSSLPSPPVPFRDPGSRALEALGTPAAGESTLEHASIELLSGGGSSQQMFDFTVGETQVVMIFDEGLEL